MGKIINHVISTNNELLTSGFRIPSRPDHNGADFVDTNRQEATLKGVDIISIADGKVVEVINGNLIGQTVAISHEGKILSRYQHMRNNSIAVKVGDTVKKGQKLGVMGNTGECISSNTSIPVEYRGTHLHIGIKENSTAYNNGEWVDPIPYLEGNKKISSTINTSTQNNSLNTNTTFNIDDKIKVIKDSKWYNGVGIASFVFDSDMYIVSNKFNDDSINISTSKGGMVTGRINANNIILVQSTSPPVNTIANFNIGDKVKVKSGSTWYNGVDIALFVFNTDMYIISNKLSDNTVHISTSKNGAVTGRINVNNLI